MPLPDIANLLEIKLEKKMADDTPPPSGPQEARIVKVALKDNVHVKSVKDPAAEKGKEEDIDIDVTGLMYGWSLKKIMDDSVPAAAQFNFPSNVMVCANDPAKADDQNTITLQPPELIKLDCGYWGSYLKKGTRARYRHFGLIQGLWVWQCELVPSNDAGTDSTSLPSDVEKYIPKGPSPVRTFFQEVQKTYFKVKINNYAQANSSPATETLDPNTLCLILPDLHLPERWPDEPDDAARPSGIIHRYPLQHEIVYCQHAPGWIFLNDQSSDQQAAMQTYMEKVIDQGSTDSFKGLFTYTSKQYLAEMAFVDRRIKAACNWFYPEGLTQDERMTGRGIIDVSPHKPVTGNPSPAVDLVNLLLVAKKVQESESVSVVQLGDLMEMWSGREFLYYYWPTCDGSLSPMAAAGAAASVLATRDMFQLRQDSGWRDPKNSSASGFKHYVYDSVNPIYLLQRHATGNYIGNDPLYKTNKDMHIAIGKRYHKIVDSIKQAVLTFIHLGPGDDVLETTGQGIVGRCSALMSQRAANCRNFCLPIPVFSDLPNDDHSVGLKLGLDALYNAKPNGEAKGEFLKRYLRGDIDSDEHAWSAANRRVWNDHSDQPQYNGEFFWNRMILETLEAVGYSNIHGNHDGYRSDPLLTSGASDASMPAQQTMGNSGIWFEHGHRWDEYNRDGRFYGAGMTNLVYYQFDTMLFLDAIQSAILSPSEQTGEQCGAAQWWRFVTFLPQATKVGFEDTKTFAIYVSGHTHVADLVRFHFETPATADAPKSDPSTWSKIKGKVADLVGNY